MLTGCAGQLEDVGRAPEMSPVGYGLAVQQPAAYPLSTFGQGTVKDYNSLWASGRDNFFADPRAKKVGDVLTVTIQINDRANMDNSSDRRRTSDIGWGGTMDYDWDGIGHGGSGNLGVDSGSGSAGSGSIDRSEESSCPLQPWSRTVCRTATW